MPYRRDVKQLTHRKHRAAVGTVERIAHVEHSRKGRRSLESYQHARVARLLLEPPHRTRIVGRAQPERGTPRALGMGAVGKHRTDLVEFEHPERAVKARSAVCRRLFRHSIPPLGVG